MNSAMAGPTTATIAATVIVTMIAATVIATMIAATIIAATMAATMIAATMTAATVATTLAPTTATTMAVKKMRIGSTTAITVARMIAPIVVLYYIKQFQSVNRSRNYKL